MRTLSIAVLALAAVLAAPPSEAQPRSGGVVVGAGWGGGARWGGGSWVGPGFRPGWGPGWGSGWGRGWGPGWGGGWGPGWGSGWGWGPGFGFGTGVGWGLAASPWLWSAPPVFVSAPAPFPMVQVAPWGAPFELQEGLTFIQQQPSNPPAEPVAPPPATRRAVAGDWYYCTEPAGYHPYVPVCTRPWIAIDPRSLPPADAAPTAARPAP